jgi:hypothetical protein
MTAYQAMLAKEAMILSKMVSEIVEGPVVLLNIGLKKALTGEEIALPSEDVAELERRFLAIKGELRATGELEEFFARRVASMTVRVERGVRLEAASLSDKVRKAAADFDASRFQDALKLSDWITADPLVNSRKLHETIEGVDRMLKSFRGLKDDLLHPTNVRWDWCHLEKVENLMGRRLGDFPISRAKALSEAIGGEFKYLEESDGEGLEDFERPTWAREQLAELIDREVDRLEAHRTTFDLEEVARERTDSVDRVLFDPSKEAALARKYEAAAERSLYKALRELRQLQKVKAQREDPDTEEPELASFFPGEVVAEPAAPAEPARPENPARDRSSERKKGSKGVRKPPRSRST